MSPFHIVQNLGDSKTIAWVGDKKTDRQTYRQTLPLIDYHVKFQIFSKYKKIIKKGTKKDQKLQG